ncbi:hypothetical protein [Bradyrhizobium genosp. SA-3]|uniref:hypothetical protein n=1 Tax=Bradyrhizobium genosp. SA-3 TaxID=508868 RepID=UPI0013EEB942|nr:hypothetical protein [Bradyrhizobium genosp. SA-3]
MSSVISERLQDDKLSAKVDAKGDMLVTYDSLETGSGYVSPAVILEFGARSTGDPLLYRSTNFVSSNRAPAKRCGKIGATRPVLRRVPMRGRSRAQQYPDLVSFSKGCGYNNRESDSC